ncbi:hypothetical protein ACVW16_007035 [Bradyrhizobium sp. USDA 4474]
MPDTPYLCNGGLSVNVPPNDEDSQCLTECTVKTV